ncbi:MAG: chemotaxis protein CheA [Alphaproteobacteria bacterium]|nr:chemotaxis protein CheA [Alphaproteobacteria bacterium]
MNGLDQFKQTYITECFELLVDMEERLMGLDVDAVDMESLNAIFRCAHSIKGGSGAFGLDYITNFTHVLEALLDSMRENKVSASREVVDTLLKAADIVTRMVHAAKDGVRPPDDLGADIKQQLEQFAGGGGAGQDAAKKTAAGKAAEGTAKERIWRIDFMPHETLFSTGNEPLLLLRELGRLGTCEVTTYTARVPEIAYLNATHCHLGWSVQVSTDKPEAAIREVFEFVTDHCDLKIEMLDLPAAGADADASPPRTAKIVPAGEDQAAKSTQTTSIRVDLDKVDRLVNMIGELVITEAMLRAQTRHFGVEQFADLMRGIDELSQHTRELQEAVMSVRMQPVKSIFSRMPRIVRDISAQLGKDIKLEMSGENTEVDKTVIEQLSDPLMHMIRNSCDHGIENPETRTANGKSAQGTILLSADHRGGRIIIEIRDDGAGINRERVLAKAREKELIAADAAPSNDEIDNMIFMAGFSTAEKVTNVSGRGVGMDVVKRNIEGMGGTVRVTNDPGKGSLFTVSLPLTLAILDGMIVRVGTEHYIIPITSIIETMRPKAEQVKRVEGHSDVINVRGEFVSVVHLHRIFNIAGAQDDPSKALVVLVESGNEKMGLVVDELIGQQQVVIKSLEANADPVQGVSGATILGDGRVSLILEINDLNKIRHEHTQHAVMPRAA